MSKPQRDPEDVFEITERPIPLRGWTTEDGAGRAAALAKDLGELLARLADARLSLEEQQTRQRENTRKTLLAILDVVDAFERVFRNIQGKQDQVTKQMKKWIGNFRTVYRMLRTVLADQGVSRIENLDQGFDPHWHKVVETVFDLSRPEGTIDEELEPGYVWHNQVLRKVTVRVVSHSEAAPQADREDEDEPPCDEDEAEDSEADEDPGQQ